MSENVNKLMKLWQELWYTQIFRN